ncbi:MAG: hypothetical protein M0Z85_07635 [Gammaproteobacteria bacterium]|nr:hypothetical protein [Gammaproteobacteria bacterium]
MSSSPTDTVSPTQLDTPALWVGSIATAGSLQDGGLRVYIDFEPALLGPVAAAMGAPGTPVALSPLQGLYGIAGASRGIRKTLADGTVRVAIDIDENDHWRAWPVIGKPKESVAVGVLQGESLRYNGSPHGAYAQALWRHRFFARRRVWMALGGLGSYRAFLAGRPCAQPGHVHNGAVEIVTLAGPDGWALPLCAKHRAYGNNPDRWPGGWGQAKRLLEMHYSTWAHAALTDAIGHPRLRETPPVLIQEWARAHGIEDLLPPLPSGESPSASADLSGDF